MTRRRYLADSLSSWARAEGLSLRTARRRADAGSIPGAVKHGNRWLIPLSTAQYAKAHEVSIRTARRRLTLSGVVGDPHIAVAFSLRPDVDDPSEIIPVVDDKRPSLGSRKYRYQGWWRIRFLQSGDLVAGYTGTLVSSQPLLFSELLQAIITWLEHMFGKSPWELVEWAYVTGSGRKNR